MMAGTTRSDGENMSEIESLASRVRDLSQSVDWWNSAMIWGLALAALAALFVLIATRVVVTRAAQLSAAQDSLSSAKDRRLQSDLKDKDVKIAETNLARIKIEQSIAWRRLTSQQQSDIGTTLRRFGVQSASLWYGSASDKEAETFAMEIASALNNARLSAPMQKSPYSRLKIPHPQTRV
jgi:hypothetical protein